MLLPPRSTRRHPLLPFTTLFRSGVAAAAGEADRRGAQPLRLDGRSVILDARRHHDVRAVVARHPSERQAVRAEVPVLADEVEDLAAGQVRWGQIGWR